MSSHEGFAAESALSHLVERLHEGVLVFDTTGSCHLVGQRVLELFGLFGADLLGLEHAEVFRQLAASLPGGASLDGDALSGPRTIELESGQVLLWTSALLPTGERLELFRDVTEERRAHALAHYLETTSDVDPETGLFNARRFRRELEREHTRAQRSWVPYAVLRLGLDGGPALRDRAGEAGLLVALRVIGERVRTARRDYDVVARWEGDELAVLLPTADARAARTVGKRIVRGLRDGDPVTLPGVSRVTVSIGAAVWSPPSVETVEDLLHRSASALQVARMKGVCSVEVDAEPGADPKDVAEP